MSEESFGPPTGAPIQFPAQPPKKRKLWPWLLSGGLFLGLLLVGGCGYLGYWFLNSSVGTGTIFASALDQDNNQAAYDSLCEKSKEEITFEEFVEDYVPSEDVTSIQPVVTGFSSEGETDVLAVRLELADGTGEVVDYPMVKEGGEWRICEPPVLK